MILQIIVLAGILFFAVNLILNLLLLRRPIPGAKLLDPPPFISIMVPARNEAANISRCLKSLQNQDYPEYEIIVLDDNSTDDTAAIVAAIQEKDQRVKLLHGKPLPTGWAGKPYACQQMVQEARGSWYLFVDADTIHEPHMLRSVIRFAVEEKVSLLSGMPQQLNSGLSQRIVMPEMYFILMSWFPIWFLNRTKKPWPTLAIGQFMLFPRDEYWRIGGHECVKTRIIEDVWLGSEVKRKGGRFFCVDLSPVMSTEMYTSIDAMTEGWNKWLYSVMAMSPLALLTLFIIAYFFFLAPFFWLAQSLLPGAQSESFFFFIVAAQVVIILAMRCATDRYFREPLVVFLFHPLGLGYIILVMLYTVAKRTVGAGVAWKDRVYDSRSQVK